MKLAKSPPELFPAARPPAGAADGMDSSCRAALTCPIGFPGPTEAAESGFTEATPSHCRVRLKCSAVFEGNPWLSSTIPGCCFTSLEYPGFDARAVNGEFNRRNSIM